MPSKTCFQPGGIEPSSTRVTASCSGSGSCHTWTIPGPCGPSRSQVGGTTSQPSASETRRAATSRSASVPTGKSHSGRSPEIGL